MPAPEFYETKMGNNFYNRDVPKFIKAVERIAGALERMAEQGEHDAQAKKINRREICKMLQYALGDMIQETKDKEELL